MPRGNEHEPYNKLQEKAYPVIPEPEKYMVIFFNVWESIFNIKVPDSLICQEKNLYSTLANMEGTNAHDIQVSSCSFTKVDPS